jgi:hypothetical protein
LYDYKGDHKQRLLAVLRDLGVIAMRDQRPGGILNAGGT